MEVCLTTSAPADVCVHLVDAAILARTRHADADPFAHFGARRRLDTRGADAYAALLSGAPYPGLASTGGDEGEADALAARVEAGVPVDVATVVLASARVAVDGVATVPSFDVPAFEGRLRLVVVAASRAGTGACARRTSWSAGPWACSSTRRSPPRRATCSTSGSRRAATA